MKINAKLLNFQAFLDLEITIQDLTDDLHEGVNIKTVEVELDKLFKLRDQYESNFLLFFESFTDNPEMIEEVRIELLSLDSDDVGNVDTDNPDSCISSYDATSFQQNESGKSWRYSVGDIVIVDETLSTFHGFVEGDEIEILTLENGEQAYQYYARYTNGEIGTFLINDEELI